MMLTEREIQACAELVARCEQSLNQRPLRDHFVDLICDNRCGDDEWSYEKCKAMADALRSGWGCGAFHMARERDKYPLPTPGAALTTVRFVDNDGTVTDIRFCTKWAARLAARLWSQRCAFVLCSDEKPCKASGKVQH